MIDLIMHKIIYCLSALFMPVVISLITYNKYLMICAVNKFLIENTITVIGVMLSVNAATALCVFNILLERVEENNTYEKYFVPLKKELKDNVTLMICLFFMSIVLVLLQKSGLNEIHFIMLVNFILSFTLILSGFAFWEMVCFYGFGIPPNLKNKE